MKRRLSILTCSRRRDYVDDTVASLDRAGATSFDGDRVVYVDGDPSGYAFDRWRVQGLPRGRPHPQTPACRHPPLPEGLLGTRAAMLEIMRLATSDEIAMLYYSEDDVRWAKNAVPFMVGMAERMPEDLAFYAFCDIKQIALHPGVTSIVGYDFECPRPGEGGHWGNLALAVPLRSLSIATQADPPSWTEFLSRIDEADHRKESPYSSDVYLGVVTATPPAPCSEYGVVSPSAAFHVGNHSVVRSPETIAAGQGRQTISYAGDDFDMMTLSWMFEGAPRHSGLFHRDHSNEVRIRQRFLNGQEIKRMNGIL